MDCNEIDFLLFRYLLGNIFPRINYNTTIKKTSPITKCYTLLKDKHEFLFFMYKTSTMIYPHQ